MLNQRRITQLIINGPLETLSEKTCPLINSIRFTREDFQVCRRPFT